MNEREMSTETGIEGHVFVVRGRLEAVASDVVIVPTDRTFVPRRTWWPALDIDQKPAPPVDQDHRARRFRPHSTQSRSAWLLHVAHGGHPSVTWLIDGLEHLLRLIDADRPKFVSDGRVRPLIALPTIGVGRGGYAGVRGKVIEALYATTLEFVAKSDFDVVFVVENAADYAAFQAIRRERSLPTRQREAGAHLASKIRGGDTALLLGAGVSISAGLPTWDELLATIKRDTLPDLDPDQFATLGVLDRAQLLSKSVQGQTLGERAAGATGADAKKVPTLAHCLLASLSVEKVVTTNYDSLYEDAFKAANGPDSISVLPRENAVGDRAWLLKMHGDVAAPESIVLSRRDFVRYDAERRPLGSIVQSIMATGHLIVIGASMTDDNVLRLAHEVLAMNATNNHQRPLGTVVTLQNDPVRSALWEGDFDYLAASDSSNMKVAARDLEILLDGTAMYSSDRSPYLLDNRYAELLSPEEAQLADHLREAAHRIRSLTPVQRSRWKSLETVLTAMGDSELSLNHAGTQPERPVKAIRDRGLFRR